MTTETESGLPPQVEQTEQDATQVEQQASPGMVDEILAAGAARVAPIARDTMAEVREKMGLR